MVVDANVEGVNKKHCNKWLIYMYKCCNGKNNFKGATFLQSLATFVIAMDRL
jgi:hypothetical protein